MNLTDTLLNTNPGWAILADDVTAAVSAAMAGPLAPEFDLQTGGRVPRADHLRGLLCEQTGTKDATVANTKAAALLIALNAFGQDCDGIGLPSERIEIGGAFRMPAIRARASTGLVEVGTTNRTHPRNYRDAITARIGLILTFYTSNYRIAGFTAEVAALDLAVMGRDAGVVRMNDLGTEPMVDLSQWGPRREPTLAKPVAEGADLITFSGDTLLGGPQAGFIVGRRDLIARIHQNPMKRALRLNKVRIAALQATLRLYRDPDRLDQRLPVLRMLSRPQAARLAPQVAGLPPGHRVIPIDYANQTGPGSLPMDTIPSAGLRITGMGEDAHTRLAAWLRERPRPVIGYSRNGALILDLRCLGDDQDLMEALS